MKEEKKKKETKERDNEHSSHQLLLYHLGIGVHRCRCGTGSCGLQWGE